MLGRLISTGARARRHRIPLYEILLRYPDRDTVVLSETPLQPGRTVQLAGRKWYVFDSESPYRHRDRTRFLCRLADEATGSAP